jgi:hypothetical protein
MVHPLRDLITVSAPKGRKEAVGGVLAFFSLGVARRPLVLQAPRTCPV